MAEARSIGAWRQGKVVWRQALARLLRARKTLVLLAAGVLPAALALAFVWTSDLEGASLMRETAKGALLPFLAPLIGLFFGGPAIVEEIEGRTLTYLTLRPVPRASIYLGKLAAALSAAAGVALASVLALGAVGLAGGGEAAEIAETWARLGGVGIAGALVYTAIFSALGAWSARGFAAGLGYFVVVELVLSRIPNLELVSVIYHMKAAAGLDAGADLGPLSQAASEAPATWVSALALASLFGVALAAGTLLFEKKTYYV